MTDKKDNMIDNIINEHVEDAYYEEEEGNDSDGRKGREARSGREKAGEAKAKEKGTSDGNKTKPKRYGQKSNHKNQRTPKEKTETRSASAGIKPQKQKKAPEIKREP